MVRGRGNSAGINRTKGMDGHGSETNSARLLLSIACCFTFTYPIGRQLCLEKASCLYSNPFLIDVNADEVSRA
jgi:hypothetical protein